MQPLVCTFRFSSPLTDRFLMAQFFGNYSYCSPLIINDMGENTSNQMGRNEDELHSDSSNKGHNMGDSDKHVNAQPGSEEGEEESTENQTSAAGHVANNTNVKQASTFRDPGRQPARANEATDRNDTGSGGLSAGGVKSGSSLQ